MKIFVSHSLNDKELVDRLHRSVKPYGITLYVAEHYVDMNNTITSKIESMIKSCDAAVILLTKNGCDSKFVQQEIGYLRSLNKPSLNVVEKEYEKAVTGFIYGHDYISYDPQKPDDTIVKVTNLLESHNKAVQKKQEMEKLKAAEKESQKKALIGIGLLVGALFAVATISSSENQE